MAIKFSQPRALQPGEMDSRYIISVILMAQKRPRYWRLHCIECRTFVCEISGDLIGLSDIADASALPDYQPAPVRIKCRGRCSLFYEISSISTKY